MAQQELNTNVVAIRDEMETSYLDYAMSVIVGRALPDVRDGLKPVHRRVLFAMRELGNVPSKPHKKSARVVGDVIGKYHPHGDAAVYETIVRMAQDFSMRYLLVDGQGNFGSVDGDPPAAMRYTEVRMAKMAEEFLQDIDKETVEFGRNYDDTLDEPLLLPAKVPSLLLNGSSGIAVGMATNIPPHNLREIIDASIAIIKKPEIKIEKLMGYVQGPDFPTAGLVYGKEGIVQAYKTGRGKIRIRARTHIEPADRGGREQIVVSEIPYQVNKTRLIEGIAKLVDEGRVDGIYDIRDESDREGMRLIIELKKETNSMVTLNQLFNYSQLQTSYGINMLALVGGRPRVINLKEALQEFIFHRKEVVTRRCVFDLARAKERAHILEGLKIALDNLDAVIKLIRAAKDPSVAKEGLVKKFKLSPIQAQAILDMRLQRLTGLERDKILTEYKEVLETIKKLEEILANETLVYEIIAEELKGIRSSYGDERRTEIVEKVEVFDEEDLIEDEDMVVTVSHEGYIKRNPVTTYRSQKRGGKGKLGMGVREKDFPENLFIASNHSYLLIFTDRGRVYWLKVHHLPQMGRVSRGKPVVTMVKMSEKENISAILPVREFKEDQFVMMATKNGVIKKCDLMAFSNPRPSGIIAISLGEGDSLIAVRQTSGKDDIFLGTVQGKGIRFPEKQVRAMGRGASGVRGMTLAKDDYLVGMEIIDTEAFILTANERGYGKRTPSEEFRPQSRGGKGLIMTKVTNRNGPVVGLCQIKDEDDAMIITNHAKLIRLSAKDISVFGRSTQGVRLIQLAKQEKVTALAKAAEEDETE
jgi:DNA gyrase subunit A